jgi:hypothetical protein
VLRWSDLPNQQSLKRYIDMPLSDETLAPNGRIHSTCAVVGSDPQTSSLGQLIDSHEAVFRANHHVGDNVEPSRFGTKTTYLLTNPEAEAILSKDVSINLDGIQRESILPLFDHINSYLYEARIFPFQSNYSVSGVRWSTTTGFASFLLAYYRCRSVDVYGFSIGLPVISLHHYMNELLAIKTLEFQNRFVKSQPSIRLFLNPEIDNHVLRWLINLERQDVIDFGPGMKKDDSILRQN